MSIRSIIFIFVESVLLITFDFVEATMDVVLKNIYTSCDSEGNNQVPAAKLIEFISPYLLQDE